jgi:hypothetical protein
MDEVKRGMDDLLANIKESFKKSTLVRIDLEALTARVLALEKLLSKNPAPIAKQTNSAPPKKTDLTVNWRGGNSTTSSDKWVSAGHKVTLMDGTVRTLYTNVSKPGDVRIRRMITQRDGRSVATYIKPSKQVK